MFINSCGRCHENAFTGRNPEQKKVNHNNQEYNYLKMYKIPIHTDTKTLNGSYL